MAVPIVSKKSVSMKLKMVRTAARPPSTVKTLVRSNWPSVEKLGVAVNVVGSGWIPTRMAMTVVTRMLMSSAAGTFRTHSATVRASATQNRNWVGVVGKTSVVGTGFSAEVPPVLTITPASMNPMNRMNRPMPTPIAYFSDVGTARMIASRRPTTTSSVTTMPSRTITPIAPCGVRPWVRTSPKATAPLMPRPAAIASGVFAMTPIAMVRRPAMRAVAAAAAGMKAWASGDPGAPNMFDRMAGFRNRM